MTLLYPVHLRFSSRPAPTGPSTELITCPTPRHITTCQINEFNDCLSLPFNWKLSTWIHLLMLKPTLKDYSFYFHCYLSEKKKNPFILICSGVCGCWSFFLRPLSDWNPFKGLPIEGLTRTSQTHSHSHSHLQIIWRLRLTWSACVWTVKENWSSTRKHKLEKAMRTSHGKKEVKTEDCSAVRRLQLCISIKHTALITQLKENTYAYIRSMNTTWHQQRHAIRSQTC